MATAGPIRFGEAGGGPQIRLLSPNTVIPPTCGKVNLRPLAILAPVAVFLLAGILVYAGLTALIEARVAASLKERYGLVQEPVVRVSSGFPPELLLGRADRIEVYIDSFTKGGIQLRNLQVDIEAVDASVPSLLQGDLEREIRSGSLTAEVPEESMNQYLRENELGLEGGEIDVQQGNVFYKSANAFFGLPASINLDLRVASPGTIEVTPEGAVVGGFPLPPFLTKPLASGGRTLTVGDLPLGAELVGVEPQDDVLMIRAER